MVRFQLKRRDREAQGTAAHQRKKHKTIKKGVETFDSEAIADGLAEHVLEAFEGFGGEDGNRKFGTHTNYCKRQ